MALPAWYPWGRGRSDATCNLRRRGGDCSWQRIAGARLAVSTHVADGKHGSGSACSRPAECGRTGTCGYAAACRGDGAANFAESAHRRTDCFSQPGRAKERQYAGIVRRHSPGCAQRSGRYAAAGGPLQRERVCDGLSSFVPCHGLHLSAEQRPAPVMREVAAETLFQ